MLAETNRADSSSFARLRLDRIFYLRKKPGRSAWDFRKLLFTRHFKALEDG